MSIYWIRTDSDNALAIMETVEQALAHGDHGQAPEPNAPRTDDDQQRENALREDLNTARSTWAINQQQIVESRRGRLAYVLHGFQQLVRRATWWYTAPQWDQATTFHAALVRIVEALHERDRQQSARQREHEQALRTEIVALELQVRTLRYEQRTLERRVAELERHLGEHEH